MNTSIKNRRISTTDLPKYSVLEWKKWEGKWELIEGIPFAMSPMPSLKHQNINGKLYRQFDELLEGCSPCEVFLPVNFKIDDNTVVHPDLLIVCDRNEDEIYVTTTPSLVVEIISRSSKKQDTITKPKIFQGIGIRYYVLIDPRKEWVKIFELKDDIYQLKLKTRNGSYHFDFEKCGADFDFSKIWK